MKKVLFLSPLPPPHYGSAMSSEMCLGILRDADLRADIGKLRSDNGGQRSDNRKLKSEGGGRMADDRKLKFEDRGRITEVRDLRSEIELQMTVDGKNAKQISIHRRARITKLILPDSHSFSTDWTRTLRNFIAGIIFFPK